MLSACVGKPPRIRHATTHPLSLSLKRLNRPDESPRISVLRAGLLSNRSKNVNLKMKTVLN